MGVAGNRLLAQAFEMRIGVQAIGRHVEADVPVAPDAEEDEVEPTGILDELCVCSGCVHWDGVECVRRKGACAVYIDLAVEQLVEEVVIALRVVAAEAKIFIHVEQRSLGEGETFSMMLANEILEYMHRG